MSEPTVALVFGTRPEAIKLAPIYQELKRRNRPVQVIVTAQHRGLLDQMLAVFEMTADVDLNIMQEGQTLAQITSRALTGLQETFARLRPDIVMVQGDTTTVLGGALAAFYERIPVAHVEAGLRTQDKLSPFPEEINRRLASVAADLHFAPTEWSRQNLLREGIPPAQVVVTGNPVIDALHSIVHQPAPPEVEQLLRENNIAPQGKKRLALVTAHRRESFGKPLEDICAALRALAEAYRDSLHLIYPVHLNPNVQEPVHRLLDGVPNISLLPPIEYLPMVHLMKNAVLVLTDSGGIQEEASGLGVPTLVMRETTERPEGVQAGVLKLVGTDRERIFNEARRLLEDAQAYQAMAHAASPFGDGHAAERIVKALLEYSS